MPPRSFGRDEKTEGHLSIHSLVKAKLTMTLLLAISIHPVYWFVKTGDQPAPYPQDAGLPRKTADRKKQLKMPAIVVLPVIVGTVPRSSRTLSIPTFP